MFTLGDTILQKQRTDSYNSASGKVVDANPHYLNEWGLKLLERTQKLCGDAKDLYKNTWYDEDGDDEYVPDELPVGSYDLELTIGAKSGADKIRDFIDYLRLGGSFNVYFSDSDDYCAGVRYESVETTAFKFRQSVRINGKDTTEDLLVFKVKLKVNEPTTKVSITYQHNGNEMIWDEDKSLWYCNDDGVKNYVNPNYAKLQ